MSTNIAEIRPSRPAPTVGFEQQCRLADAFARSGLFGIKTAEQALALMALCEAEGMHPAIAVRDYHIIQGKPALKADAMMARFQNAGGRVKWLEMTDERVAGEFSHPAGGTVMIDWDKARATTAGFWGKDNWKKFPRAMLRARVISEGIRTVFPGVVVGTYTPEEVQDFDEPKKSKRDAGEAAPTHIGPTSGLEDVLSSDERASLEALADAVDNAFQGDGVEVAAELLEAQNLDNDGKAWLWKSVDSKTRTALRKHYEAKKGASNAV
jgi:hypothetical protein